MRNNRKDIRQVFSGALDVDDSGDSSYVADKDYSLVEWENTGSNVVWHGDLNVHVTNKIGIRLLPTAIFTLANVKKDFKITFKTPATTTSKISFNQYF